MDHTYQGMNEDEENHTATFWTKKENHTAPFWKHRPNHLNKCQVYTNSNTILTPTYFNNFNNWKGKVIKNVKSNNVHINFLLIRKSPRLQDFVVIYKSAYCQWPQAS